jgi:hypothetical protein
MNTFKEWPWSERIAIEDANAVLSPAKEICPPPDGVNALIMGTSRCQCGRCSLNRAIHRGIFRVDRLPGSWERIPNFRFGLGALGELGILLKAGLCVLGVTVVLAGPMAAIQHASVQNRSHLTIGFSLSAVRLPTMTVEPYNPLKTGVPVSSKPVTAPPTKPVVPEVLTTPPSAPTGFKVLSPK